MQKLKFTWLKFTCHELFISCFILFFCIFVKRILLPRPFAVKYVSGDKKALFHWLPFPLTIARFYSWVKKAFSLLSAFLSALNHPATGLCSVKGRLMEFLVRKLLGKSKANAMRQFPQFLAEFSLDFISLQRKKQRKKWNLMKLSQLALVIDFFPFLGKKRFCSIFNLIFQEPTRTDLIELSKKYKPKSKVRWFLTLFQF